MRRAGRTTTVSSSEDNQQQRTRCLDAANTARDIDFYHWSSQSFGDFWKDALSVLMARERARIGLAASKGDWPRRIAAYARDEQEDAAAYADS